MIEINPKKTTSVSHLGTVEIAALTDRLHQIKWDQSDDFEANYNKNNFGALKSTQHSVLRFTDKRHGKITYRVMDAWHQWKEILLPILTATVVPYGYSEGFFPKVMFALLPAGSFIPPHVDGDTRGHVPHKIHIPLLTNEKTFFFQGKERHHFEVGHAYEVNNGEQHSVVNGGDTDRIHLIFEYLDIALQSSEVRQQIASISTAL